MARQTEPAPSEIPVSGNVYATLHSSFVKAIVLANGRNLYVNTPLVFGGGSVDQITFFYSTHALGPRFSQQQALEAVQAEFGKNCVVRSVSGTEEGMPVLDYYLWFKSPDNSKGTSLVGCYRMRMFVVESVTTALLLRLGYRGYGKLISHILAPFDFVFENERVEYQIKADNGDVLHSVYVTEDSHAVDSILGLDRAFPRISYGLNSPAILMEKLISSPLFTLKGACLNEDLTSSVEAPSGQLAAFQEYVLQKHQVASFPETPQKAQLKFVTKFLNENINGFSKLHKTYLDYYYRKQIYNSKLDEVKLLMGEKPFTTAFSKMKETIPSQKLEFEILSGNPVSLTERFHQFLQP